MNILVTGAEGFLGSEICAYLSERNHRVIKFIRKKDLKDFKGSDLKSSDTFYGDITDQKSFLPLSEINDIQVLIHTAGLAHQFGKMDEEKFRQVNVWGTKNISELAEKLNIEHFILISSVSVYGSRAETESITEFDENSICQPNGFYAKSKYRSEEVCREILDSTGIDLTILRPATIIGEEDRGNVFRLIDAIYRGKFFRIGNGCNKKSLIYKKDVARAIDILLSKKNPGTEIFNVAAECLTMNEIVSEISESLGKKIYPFSVPTKILVNPLKFFYAVTKIEKIGRVLNSLQKWSANDIYPVSKLSETYGFKPETPVKKGLQREVTWYLERKNL